MKVSREAVLAAIQECNTLGQESFLARYGYRPSLRHVLYHEGKAYPSKAILGVAAQLHARDFFGGAAHTVRTLAKLGFSCRRFDRDLAGKVLAAAAAGFVGVAALSSVPLNAEPLVYFASGSNHAGEIRGLSEIDMDVGVAAPEVNAQAEVALMELAGTDVQVFVDSGAFSEVAFTEAGPVWPKPITHERWIEILALYRRLGLVLGDQLHVVAPDMVASQEGTLARLTTYAAAVRELHDMGVRVLVALQKGALSQADFAKAVTAVLGFDSWTPALPCKKAATTPEDLRAYLSVAKPARLHLLGIGPGSEKAPAYFDALRDLAPDCLFTCDAVLFKRFVGHTRKQNHFTRARGLVMGMFGGGEWTIAAQKHLSTVLAFGGAL